ncbi:YidC/Oxa1 family membrane protein insertase [Patescibacteria group bacterium]|nr:YidC/Oxa1 family membrane protein insertase [Patescibacteria group bacterium]
MLTTIYHTILYQPILNLLVFFYNIIPGNDLGLAIILLTIVIKIIFSPLFVQSIKAQRAMQAIQPKLNALKEKYKDNKEKMGVATMDLYKQEKVNPLSSCLPLLIQLPFLIAVYQVFRTGLTGEHLDLLYSFIYNPGSLNPISFGILNLSKASIVMALLAGLAQFWQSKTMLGKQQKTNGKEVSLANTMTRQMTYMMPVLTVVIGASLPAGLTLYWFLVTILGALQQFIIFKRMDKRVPSSS